MTPEITHESPDATVAANEGRLFASLKRLLASSATTLTDTLASASDMLAEVLGAEKVDAFLLEPASQTLVAVGVSDTPLAMRQRAVGLDRLPIVNGGRSVGVFTTGEDYHCGDVQADTGEIVGIREALGIQSGIAVPLAIGGQRRGVMHVTSTRRDAFDRSDLEFLRAVTHWIGVAAHRAELVQELAVAAELEGRRAAAEELLVVFSHDLRNHLWTVSLRLQGLQQRAAEAGRVEDVRELGRLTASIHRLDGLSRDLLDVERLDRGLFVLKPALVDVVPLVRGTAELMSTPDAPIRVEAPDARTVVADADALRQALENLLTNACKHSPPGAQVQVSIRDEPPGPRLAILVRDFGPGIAPELAPRLFHRFSRGHGSQGLGLGLHLARKLVEAHGGTLDLVAHDGVGACFRVLLPAHGEPSPQTQPGAGE